MFVMAKSLAVGSPSWPILGWAYSLLTVFVTVEGGLEESVFRYESPVGLEFRAVSVEDKLYGELPPWEGGGEELYADC